MHLAIDNAMNLQLVQSLRHPAHLLPLASMVQASTPFHGPDTDLLLGAAAGQRGEVLLDVRGAVGEVVVALDAAVLEAAGGVLAEVAVLLLQPHALQVHVRHRLGPGDAA